MWWILIAVACAAFLYRFLKKKNEYWIERNVKQTSPFLILGDNWSTLIRKQSSADMIKGIYEMYPNDRYLGWYQFFIPTLMLKDPELIKQITIKDFDHFTDHRPFVPADADPLWSKNLFALTGQKWRDMRSTLSPTFTSSKMKVMFVLIIESAEQFLQYFLKQKDDEIITIDMKDVFTRFTNDVIANTSFGVKCDSLRDRNNEFYLMGKEATSFSRVWTKFKIIAYFFIPKVLTVFKIGLFSDEVGNFFKNIVKQTIRTRTEQNIVRPDMINLLMEARKNGMKYEENDMEATESFAAVKESKIGTVSKTEKLEFTDLDITAQALIFFFAGFDTVSTQMCFMAYELAVETEVQNRLLREIQETLAALPDKKLSYEALSKMKYLDMVVSETLRKWPSVIFIDRFCTKPYTIQPVLPDEKPLHIEVNTTLTLPIFPLHRDPKYYPNPDRFDPERFNDENKSRIKPYTYMPFGIGPRGCIGSRFAILELKTIFVHLLTNFEIVPVEKTQIPLKICKTKFTMDAEGGFWLGFKRRNVL